MKKIKIMAVVTAAIVLCINFLMTAGAIDAWGEALGALGEYFGTTSANNGAAKDPDENDNPLNNGSSQIFADSGILNVIGGIADTAGRSVAELYSIISGYTDGFDINSLIGADADTINQVLNGLLNNAGNNGGGNGNNNGGSNNGGGSNSGGNYTIPSFSIPQYTNVIVTEAPRVTYNYNSGTTYPGMTTSAGETTSSDITGTTLFPDEGLTTRPYNYGITDIDSYTEPEKDGGITIKMMIGISILIVSAIAVVFVVIKFNKSKV